MMSPSAPTSMGFENPNAWMLPAISATCASLCVRALRADGMSRATGHISKRKRSMLDTASVLFILLLASFVAWLLAPSPQHPPPPPEKKFGGILRKYARAPRPVAPPKVLEF